MALGYLLHQLGAIGGRAAWRGMEIPGWIDTTTSA